MRDLCEEWQDGPVAEVESPTGGQHKMKEKTEAGWEECGVCSQSKWISNPSPATSTLC